MLASRQIEVGKCYVNENDRSARQILHVDNSTVVFSHYELENGRLCGSPNKRCSKAEIIHWADREATPRESDSLRRTEQEALYRREPASSSQPPHLEDSLTAVRDDLRRMNFLR